MKRIIAIALLICLLLPMIACDVTIKTETPQTPTESPTDNGDPDTGDENPPSADQTAYETYLKYDLGTGINAITGSYLETQAFATNEFLDRKALASIHAELRYRKATDSDIDSVTGETIEAFTRNFSTSYANGISANLGIESDAIGFNATFSNKFSIADNFNLKQSTKQFYLLSYQKIADQDVYIYNFEADRVKAGAVSSYATNQLEQMRSLEGAALDQRILDFFDDFGTHVVTGATYGGKVEIYYYTLTNDSEWSSSASVDLSQKLELSLKAGDINAGVGLDNSLASQLGLSSNSQDTIAKFSANFIGVSNGVQTYGYDQLSTAYAQWISEYNAQDEHLTMIDIKDDGLLPIWELVPDAYGSIAARMKELFTKELQRTNSSFLERFDFEGVVENENTTDFAGGNGSAQYPYLIANYVHLSNIRKDAFNKANIYFKLANDIDLSGQLFDAIDCFSGIIDGDGHAITNLIIQENAVHVGLFATFSGTLENLTVSNATVSVSSEEKDVTVGIIAGVNNGTIRSCKVLNSSVSGETSYSVGTSDRLKISVGGFAGANTGTIEDCEANAVTVYGYSNIGVSDGQVEANCGAIAGMSTGGKITSCTVSASDMTAKVRGGKTWTATKYRTYARAGGICGYNSAQISFCAEQDNTFSVSYETTQGGAPSNYNKQGAIVGCNDGIVSHNSYTSLENEVG